MTSDPAKHPPAAYEAIVVGGSSGGIDALMTLLPLLPSRLRAAMLIVLHLPRDRPSLLAGIFSERCALPVREAQDKEAIAPGTVYVAPPDYHLLVDHGPGIVLSVDAPVHFSRPAIDVLFESAADLYGDRVIGVLLSGANEDGAAGLHAIHAAGGLVVVQDPASALVSTMPQAALQRTRAHHTLPPAGIAALLAGFHERGLI